MEGTVKLNGKTASSYAGKRDLIYLLSVDKIIQGVSEIN